MLLISPNTPISYPSIEPIPYQYTNDGVTHR